MVNLDGSVPTTPQESASVVSEKNVSKRNGTWKIIVLSIVIFLLLGGIVAVLVLNI